ncbi:uncharacterized protein L203_104951 [Cryptococcus depauperatus CBS 7841]|uniref:Uncharacterized protein n=1 Tax=Cryptococcus depauperatus CBS 7841 TaxID=1295531 RepID=A0AAJ8JWC9_9TREE
MPDPPISPTPRRWRASPESPHPDFAALLSTFESTSTTDDSLPTWATPKSTSSERRSKSGGGTRGDGSEGEYMTALDQEVEMPDIRTTSPSPQRPVDARPDMTLSPLLPPSRTMLFGGDALSTDDKAGLSRHFASPNFSEPPKPILPQVTGQSTRSTTTIDAAYDGVLSQLDALANPGSSYRPSSTLLHAQGIADSGPSTYQSMPTRQPLIGLGVTFPDPRASFGAELSRLSTVSERTERSSNSSRSQTSPVVPGAWRDNGESAVTIARRYPLPPSPSKKPQASSTPQATPKKTSDLIKMFESKATPTRNELPPIPQPSFVPSPSKIPSSKSYPLASDAVFNPPPLPARPTTAPTPPPKPTSPLSQVRTMIASWRTKTRSPSSRSGSVKEGSPRLSRGSDKGWNVSIRRRKRDEKELAERQVQEQYDAEQDREQGNFEYRESEREGQDERLDKGKEREDAPLSRQDSIQSDKKSSEPKQFTGEAIKTGALYYLNVHEEELKPNYEWVQADGRLYADGLELTWISTRGRATVTLDLEYCDEVASTYSPNNPMAGDDIGAAAAKRQGSMADSLYPFKLVSTQFKATNADVIRCTMMVLSDLHVTVLEIEFAGSASLRANRSSSDHGSDAGGSATTHFSADHDKPLPSPIGSTSHPLYTTDDAVIETSGGLHAPIIQRGSRKLAAHGVERVRSLRRIASEADLRESANEIPPPIVSPRTTLDTYDIPLTAANAERPSSRDFTFAHGIRPPNIRAESETTQSFYSPMQGTSTVTPAIDFHSLDAASTYRTALPSDSGYTAQPGSTYAESSYTARLATQSRAQTPAFTAYGVGSESVHTGQPLSATQGTVWGSHSPSMYTPRVNTIATTAQEPSLGASAVTSLSREPTPVGTAQPMSNVPSVFTAQAPSDVETAEMFSPSASSHTARQRSMTPNARGIVSPPTRAFPDPSVLSPSTPADMARTTVEMQVPSGTVATEVPQVAVTGASPNERDTRAANPSQFSNQYIGDVDDTTTYETAPMSRMSKTTESSDQLNRPSATSRDSHYSTAWSASTSNKSLSVKALSATNSPGSPKKYQLHDRLVPSFTTESQHHSDPRDSHFGTPESSQHLSSEYLSRPRTTQYTTAQTRSRSTPSVGTAPTSPSQSPRSSEWETAPPPPISHDSRSRKTSSSRDTNGLVSRRGSVALTMVSHPGSNDDMWDALERSSSTGSMISQYPWFNGQYATTAITPSRTVGTANTPGEDRSTMIMPFELARENTLYETARDSVYTGTQSWQIQSASSTYMATAPNASSYFSAQGLQTPRRSELTSSKETTLAPFSQPVTISTASTVVSPRKAIPRVPPPSIPDKEVPPSPSVPSDPTSSSWSTESSSTVRENTDVNRLLNFLQGQEMAKQGQTTRVSSQLDRIELKVNQIAENQTVLARDQPTHSDINEESTPPSSPSSTCSESSTETARPVTPPPLLIPEVINQQFDDLRNLLGTLIGRQEDLLGKQNLMARELDRRRSIDVELPSRGPGLSRLEDLLKRVLNRVGDSEFVDEFSMHDEKKTQSFLSTPKPSSTQDGSIYEGGDSVYSDEFNNRGLRAPANSMTSEYKRRRHGPPSSLTESEIPSPEFDEEFALSGLPPDTPPEEYIRRQPINQPKFMRQTPRQPAPAQFMPQQPSQVMQEQPMYHEDIRGEEPRTEYEPSIQAESEHEATPVPLPKDITPQETPVQHPIPFRTEYDYHDEPIYHEDQHERGPARDLPPPQPVNLPTPVNSPRNIPHFGSQPGPSLRPPYPPGPMPLAPGMTEMPRPSMPRIAGVRDPISTTYFRRGFPPGPPMMGMFPGPMGIPGPGMGPFMPGLRPGISGYGGPLGPNVNPSLRRPGFFPPGVTSTTGDYGLPAAAHYPNGQIPPGGPIGQVPFGSGSGLATTADTGLGNTTSESTVSTTSTPSALTEEIVTPVATHTHMDEPVEVSVTASHVPPPTQIAPTVAPPPSIIGAQSDDGMMRALDNVQTLGLAQGDQQNDMSRYLHGMSDQIAEGTLTQQNQLAEILGDIASLREQLKPKHIRAHVLPDGTVQLANGDIIDGIRGVPAPIPIGVPAPLPPPPSAPHVEGKIMPDGTVMVGGKIVDGIKGAPTAPTPDTPHTMLEEEIMEEEKKNAEQDKKLAELQEKIEELMARTVPKETIFEEEEIISIGGSHKADTDSPPVDASALATPTATNAHLPTIASMANGPSSNGSREKTVIREREIVRDGPHGKKEVVFEEDLEKVATEAGGFMDPATIAATLPHGTVIGTHAPASVIPSRTMGDPSVMGSPAPSSRVNPRTGKPLSMPALLSQHGMTASGAPEQLVREEHEEIVSRPTNGGPPVTTRTTTRSYTQLPHGTVPLASGAGSGLDDPAAVFADPAGVPSVHHTMPALSEYPSSEPAMSQFNAAAPGARYSDHQSAVAQRPPGTAAHHSMHDSAGVIPGTMPLDPRNTSVHHSQQPGTVANVAPSHAGLNDFANVPTGGGAPSAHGTVPPVAGSHAASNVPSTKTPQVWETNRPRPLSDKAAELANVPTDAVPSGNYPADYAVAPSALPNQATPASTDGSKKNGVHWDPRLPTKEVSGPDPRTPKTPAHNLPPATELANIPVTDESDPGNVGKHHEPPVGTLGDTPVPGGAHSDHTSAHEDSSHKTPLSGILRKPKSDENIKASSDHAVTGPPMPTYASDHNSHVSGPTSVDRPPTMAELMGEGRDLTVHPGGHTVHVPTHSAPSTPNKLKKPLPSFGNGSLSSPRNVAANVPAGSSVGPSHHSIAGSRAPSEKSRALDPDVPILEPVTLPDGTTAYIKSALPSVVGAPSHHGAHHDAPFAHAGADGATLIPPPGARPPSTLRKSAPGSERDISIMEAADAPKSQADHAANVHTPAESELGKGHCSVCCPHGARLPSGIPIEACAHQDGALGEAVPGGLGSRAATPSGPRSHQSVGKLSKPPSMATHVTPDFEDLPGHGEELYLADHPVDESIKSAMPPGTPGKLSKGHGTPSLSPEEEAMEDARKLAAKQKAAAEQAASEKVERDARVAEKEAKRQLAEERHLQNMEALTNLQKILDMMTAEQQANKAMKGEKFRDQEKRREDKAARDKKITEVLDKLVSNDEDLKKKEAANEKKPTNADVLEAFRKLGSEQADFLKKLGKDITEHNSNQHEITRQTSKTSAREQVGFNLAGYIDDFAKALSGEVRVLLKEVGDLRESRRALYMEMAELLLMKGRQSAGDLMGILPYPTAPPKNPANQPKPEKKPDPPAANGENPKLPAGVPFWSPWAPPMPPGMAGMRPLPQPSNGAVPPPPPGTGTRPLPQVL